MFDLLITYYLMLSNNVLPFIIHVIAAMQPNLSYSLMWFLIFSQTFQHNVSFQSKTFYSYSIPLLICILFYSYLYCILILSHTFLLHALFYLHFALIIFMPILITTHLASREYFVSSLYCNCVHTIDLLIMTMLVCAKPITSYHNISSHALTLNKS